MTDLIAAVGRGRALFSALWVSAFGLFGLYIIVRMIAQGADALGVTLIGAFTAVVWWRAWTLFQRFRQMAAAPPE